MSANVWVYKCNRNEQEFARAFGDWKDVFQNSKTKEWGGSWCTGNSVSKHIMNDLMQNGDLVLAYQTNDRNLVGVCRLVKITGERNERTLFMKPQHRFDPPVAIHDLKDHIPELRSVSAFSGGFPQTVYEITESERRILERAFAINLTVDASEPALPPKLSTGGACFGDPITNRKVERAAVRFVSQWYRRQGWKVKTVEAEKCGYDLKCRRDGAIEHVEVKGVNGDEPCFNLTASELTQAENNPTFIICIVTLALSRRPHLFRLTGPQLRMQYRFRPLQYHVTPAYCSVRYGRSHHSDTKR